MNARCTFTVGDSHLGPADVGTLAAFERVLAGLVEGSRDTGLTLGRPGVDPLPACRTSTAGAGPSPPARWTTTSRCRSMDWSTWPSTPRHSSSTRASAVRPSGDLLAGLADRLGLGLEWHAGFELTAAEVGPDFRGPAIPPLAAHICERYAGRCRPTTGSGSAARPTAARP